MAEHRGERAHDDARRQYHPSTCPICGSRFPYVRCFLGWAGEAGPCDNDWHYPHGRSQDPTDDR